MWGILSTHGPSQVLAPSPLYGERKEHFYPVPIKCQHL